MSRNGPVTGRGAQPQQHWQQQAESEPAQSADAAAHQPYQWPALGSQQPGYGYQQNAQHGYPQEQPENQYQAYHFPHESSRQAAPAPQQPPLFGQRPAPQAPAANPFTQFDQYLQAHQQAAASQQRAHHDPAMDASGYARRPEPFQNPGLAPLTASGQPRQTPQQQPPQASLRDQLRAAQYDQWPQQQPPDTRNYDLGSYMPSGSPGHADYSNQAPGSHSYDEQWQDPHAYGGGMGGHPGEAGYYNEHGEALPVAGQQDDHDHDDADYEYEEPRRGRRGLMIVGALVGAIIVGGGMAYAYKIVLGPSSNGTPPVIKADQRPTKIQPVEPGGKQFAHSDSKLMGRLESDGSGGATDADGVRRVPTVMVSRDGSFSAPSEPRLPPPPPSSSTVSVPGMTIVDGFGGRAQPLPPPRPMEMQRSAQPPSVPPPPPQIIAKAEPTPPSQVEQAASPVIQTKRTIVVPPSAAAMPAVAEASPPTPPAAARKLAVREPASIPAVAPAPRTSSTGYVAVLSSQKSRMDALKTFADLQQKYTSVLQNKIPDVQEADLSARGLGTMYRVVVGPPSSREAAADVCGQLKTAGFTGCWVTAY